MGQVDVTRLARLSFGEDIPFITIANHLFANGQRGEIPGYWGLVLLYKDGRRELAARDKGFRLEECGEIRKFLWVEEHVARALQNEQPVMPDLAPPLPRNTMREPEPGEEMTLMLPGNVPLVFCWCPATTSAAWKRISGEEDFFWMGSPEGELGRSSDETRHPVKLTRGYWMGKYPVTQRQWVSVAGENPSAFKQSGLDAPVENVSWEDVQEWIGKADRKLGFAGLRLPTEAEWEHGCRAGTTSALNNGLELVSEDGYCPNLARVGWYAKTSEGKTQPVGKLRGNGWGMHEVHGNVWEWCQDWYGDYAKGLVVDPRGPGSGSLRVFRGGSWTSSPGTAVRRTGTGSRPATAGTTWGCAS